MRKRKKPLRNNKGMSLVEVIIAITILGIVVVPVLQAMTSAMTYNAKARVRQKLTLTAESIMETFKGYDLESLENMFKDGSFPDISSDSTVTYGVTKTADSSDSALVTYDFNINNIVQNGKTYSAEITLTPNGKSTVLELDKATDKNDAVYVAQAKDYSEDININNAIYNKSFTHASAGTTESSSESTESTESSSGSVVSTESTETTIEAGYVDFYNKFILKPYDEKGEKLLDKDGKPEKVMCDNGTASGKTIDSAEDLLSSEIEAYVNFKDHIKVYDRVLTLTIDTATDSGKTVYTVNASMVYHYGIEGFSFYTATYPEPVSDAYLEADKKSGTSTEESSSASEVEEAALGDYHSISYPLNTPTHTAAESDYLVYKVDNVIKLVYSSENAPDRLFVYYYPYYDVESANDKIEINNKAGVSNLECYIIKQKNSSLSDSTTAMRETSYKATVSCDSLKDVVLYHNFKTNIGGKDSVTTTAGYDATGFKNIYDLSEVLDATNEKSKTSGFSQDEVLSYNIKLVIKDSSGNTVSKIESSKNEHINETKKSESGTGG
jgi:prepilin-type N-terminal cleavage/methylation domain-containing protein